LASRERAASDAVVKARHEIASLRRSGT
jgi:hypothetical protein